MTTVLLTTAIDIVRAIERVLAELGYRTRDRGGKAVVDALG